MCRSTTIHESFRDKAWAGRRKMKQVVVFDYGFGSVRSIVRALAYIGLDVILISDHVQALKADGLVVLGVVHSRVCMGGMRAVRRRRTRGSGSRGLLRF
jgi:carbamoylphosphate synthase small subunit